MTKDKKWLKEELVQSYLKESEIYLDGKVFQKVRYFEISEKKLFNLIDQLDEPEVLSQEWIDEHIDYADVGGDTSVYTCRRLKSLLVPKQELPVIPQFVADEFDYNKKPYWEVSESEYVSHILKRAFGNEGKPSEFLDWVRENPEDYVMAVRKGYEVEKEQKYYVSERDEEYGGFWFLSKNNNGNISIGVNRDWSEVDWDRLKLTEQEIKDYDPRYWAFRKPVEELEE